MPSSRCGQCGAIAGGHSFGQPWCHACGATLPVELYWQGDTACTMPPPGEQAEEDDVDRLVAAIDNPMMFITAGGASRECF